MKYFLVLSVLVLSSCVTSTACKTPDGARVVLSSTGTCTVRIRQVMIGSEMKIPEKLKSNAYSGYRLDWVDGSVTGNKIVLGHFILVPREVAKSKRR